MIIGNYLSQELTKKAIKNSLYPILLEGIEGIGKYSYISDAYQESETPFSTVDVYSVSEIKQSIFESKSGEVLVVRDFEEISLGGQDAFLKTLEDRTSRWVIISKDLKSLSASLQSRIRSYIKWDPLKYEDLRSIHSNKFYYDISLGSYSVFNNVYGDEKFVELYDLLLKEDWPNRALTTKIPNLLESKITDRNRLLAISNTFLKASRNASSKYRNSFLTISNLMLKEKTISLSNLYYIHALKSLV